MYYYIKRKRTTTKQRRIKNEGQIKENGQPKGREWNKETMCKYYVEGRCMFGQNCRNVHEKRGSGDRDSTKNNKTKAGANEQINELSKQATTMRTQVSFLEQEMKKIKR